jgi:hypothetical protein
VKPRIHLAVDRADGRRSNVEIDGAPVTTEMLDAAEDLLHTLTTGERPPPRGLYELCSLAFGTTREDAKRRLTGAAYGRAVPPSRESSFVPIWRSTATQVGDDVTFEKSHAFADGDDWSLCGMMQRERTIEVPNDEASNKCGRCIRCAGARAARETSS